jgi:uncharacterized Tic20 family protein
MSNTPPTLPPENSPAPALPAAPANNALTQDDLTMGMLAHLIALLAGIIGSVIMYCVTKDRSPFIQHHNKEALNFQLTFLIIELSGILIGTVAGVLTLGFALIIIVPLLMIVMILFLVFEIMACIAANKGEWHRYPWSIRFIK